MQISMIFERSSLATPLHLHGDVDTLGLSLGKSRMDGNAVVLGISERSSAVE